MASLSRLLSRLLAALLLTMLAQAALADPPGRVGRLAELQGSVWFYDTEAAEWVAAEHNRPLTTGDRLATDGNARAELRIGSTTLRLAGATEVELLQLDDERVRVQLHDGLLALRLQTHEAAREFELVTAEGRFQPESAGRYRLDRVDAISRVTVWSGQLSFDAPGNAVSLGSGQRADVWYDGRSQYTMIQPQHDAFAEEVAASERADEGSVAATYVSPEMTGGEDLDRYGRWENDPEYGALWVPRAVEPGWAPYRFGHWIWVRPWGWTWVDDAPWGFAPFHYGRWVHRRNVWGWVPGRWVARPVYAPALVAWVGAPGFSVSIGIGSAVGWFPLAPREVFVPGYRTSQQYVRNVNVTHVTNIRNVTNIVNNPNAVVEQTSYRNRGVPGAMTVVPASVVSGRQPVAPARVHLTDPRPGDGRMRGIPAAGSARMMAAPEIEVPMSRRGNRAGFARPAAPSGGMQEADSSRPHVASPVAPGVIATQPARRSAPPPPAAPPVIGSPLPAAATAPRQPGRGQAPGPSSGTQESAGTPSVRAQPGRGQAPGPSSGTQESAGTPSVRAQPGRGQAPAPTAATQEPAGTPSSRPRPPQSEGHGARQRPGPAQPAGAAPPANAAMPVPAPVAVDPKASPAPAQRTREPKEEPRERNERRKAEK
jgi:hypothetical protein